jgi:hypothetical protein
MIRMFSGLPDPLIRGVDQDPDPSLFSRCERTEIKFAK